MFLLKLAVIYLSLALSGVRALQCSQEHGSDFTFVDAGGGQAFVKRTGGSVYRWCNYRWIPVKGAMKQINVNGPIVYGADNSGNIHRYLHGNWFSIQARARQVIAKRDDVLFLIGLTGYIDCSLQYKDDPLRSSFMWYFPISEMACGLDDCWGIDSSGDLRYITTTSTCAISLSSSSIPGDFVALDVSDNGVVYVIDSKSKLYQSVGVKTNISSWVALLPGKNIKSFSVDGDQLWLVTVEGTIMLCNV